MPFHSLVCIPEYTAGPLEVEEGIIFTYLVDKYLGNACFMPSIVQGGRDPAVDKDKYKYVTFPRGRGQTKHKQMNK